MSSGGAPASGPWTSWASPGGPGAGGHERLRSPDPEERHQLLLRLPPASRAEAPGHLRPLLLLPGGGRLRRRGGGGGGSRAPPPGARGPPAPPRAPPPPPT